MATRPADGRKIRRKVRYSVLAKYRDDDMKERGEVKTKIKRDRKRPEEKRMGAKSRERGSERGAVGRRNSNE